MTWLAHSIRCVLMTPFGWPVEPDVNRNLAIVSGPTRRFASSIAGPGAVAASSENKIALRPAGGWRVTTISASAGTAAASALPNICPSDANTSPGVSRVKIWRSLPKSVETSE